VLSGRRFALTYNLVRTKPAPQKAFSTSPMIVFRLQEILHRWQDGIDKNFWLPTALAQILEHRYAEENLSFDKLKGRDHLDVLHLRDACEPLQVSVYMCNLSKESRVEADLACKVEQLKEDRKSTNHGEPTRYGEAIILQNVKDFNGGNIAENLNFDEAGFIQEFPFGFTRNESMPLHWHNRTVCMFQPSLIPCSTVLTHQAGCNSCSQEKAF
jgi:hypothetical protein